MAKILSHVWSIARGSIAGITYTANQYHSIIARQRVAPTNPGTNFQTFIRSAFTAAVAHWFDLAEDARTRWAAYASTLTYQGPSGNYQLPGREVFLGNLSTRMYLAARGVAEWVFSDIPPVVPGFLGLSVLPPGPPVAIGTGFALSFVNPNPEDIVVYFEISAPYNQTRLRYYGPYSAESLTALDIAGESPGTIDVLGLEVDMVYFVKIRAISDAGPVRMAAETKLRIIAQATAGP